MGHDEKIGYNATTNKFSEACKSSSEDTEKRSYGCIDVDDSTPHLNQLWGTMCALIQKVNGTMRSFMQIFRIEKGKGVSSFYREFDNFEYLRKYFMSYVPKKRGGNKRDVALDVDDTEY